MPKKHDWEVIRRDYVQGYVREDGTRFSDPRYADVAMKHGVSESTIRKVGANENWPDQRNMFRTRMEHAQSERRIDALADTIVKFDGECASTATALLSIIRGKMTQVVAVDASGRRDVTASTGDLQALASALVKAQTVGRLAMGESTENTKTEWAVITPDLGMA